jgi:hypothetical protein
MRRSSMTISPITSSATLAGIREWSIKDWNATLARRVQINLISSHAETARGDQSVSIGKKILRQLGSRTNAQQVDASDGLAQRFLLEGCGDAFDRQIFRIREQLDRAVVHALKEKDLSPLIGR